MKKILAGIKILLSLAFLSSVALAFLQAMKFLLHVVLPELDVSLLQISASWGLILCGRYLWKFLKWFEKQIAD